MLNIISRAAMTLALIALGTLSTHAGDFAKRHIHGFSIDGGLFAFEEYGVQDGSGFPYSNIYVIDTATDQWTAGSPFRARLEDETKTVFDAREEARILAGPVMKSFEDRGNLVATNQPTEKGIDTKRMVANPRIVVPPIDEDIEFRLDRLELAAPSVCADFGASAGFRLTQIGIADGDTTRVLHEDTSIPSSRNCPLDYDFADLITYFPENGTPVAAILVLMRKVGFEGPDGRYLAVTTPLQ
ncbi:MAG: DUF2259 domain-containing protein [Pseudomonadota bacterium]